METSEIKVNVLRSPTTEDWNRCKDLAMRTSGKKFAGKCVTPEWQDKILTAAHSPIRTLVFTIEMTIPYFVSVHLVRHKIGVEHYVQSQRNDRQSNYDREVAPQNAPVLHTMEINAESLMFMARRRLCGQADPTTRYVMSLVCKAIEESNPEFKGHLVPMCVYQGRCPEFRSCGYYERTLKYANQEVLSPAT